MTCTLVEKWVYKELAKQNKEELGPLVEVLWDKFCYHANVFHNSYFDYKITFLERENNHISNVIFSQMPEELVQYLASYAERIEGGDAVQQISFVICFVNIALTLIAIYKK